MAIIQINLDINKPTPQDVLERINNNYSEQIIYDEENPPLSQKELKEISARVKMKKNA